MPLVGLGLRRKNLADCLAFLSGTSLVVFIRFDEFVAIWFRNVRSLSRCLPCASSVLASTRCAVIRRDANSPFRFSIAPRIVLWKAAVCSISTSFDVIVIMLSMARWMVWKSRPVRRFPDAWKIARWNNRSDATNFRGYFCDKYARRNWSWRLLYGEGSIGNVNCRRI